MKESLSKLSERSLKITYKRKINDTKVLLFATTINLKTKILFIFICNVFIEDSPIVLIVHTVES